MQPEEIASREFLTALRGYDCGEVRSFLQQVAAEYAEILAQRQEATGEGVPRPGTGLESSTAAAGLPAPTVAEGRVEEVRLIAADGKPGSDVDPCTESDSPLQFVQVDRISAQLLECARETAKNLLRSAEDQADEIRHQAVQDAARIRNDAQHAREQAAEEAALLRWDAQQVREDAIQARHDAAHARAEAERQAQARLEEAGRASSQAIEDARAQARQLLNDAERAASETRRLAERAAASLLEEAQAHAEAVVMEAAGRRRAGSRISELTRLRERLVGERSRPSAADRQLRR